jgi:hypothetical protein
MKIKERNKNKKFIHNNFCALAYSPGKFYVYLATSRITKKGVFVRENVHRKRQKDIFHLSYSLLFRPHLLHSPLFQPLRDRENCAPRDENAREKIFPFIGMKTLYIYIHIHIHTYFFYWRFRWSLKLCKIQWEKKRKV